MDESPKKTRRCEEVYEMEEIIGEGTFSSVVRASHNDNQREVAIKIIDKSKIENSKQLLRVYNEIALHRKARHPCIIKYIEHYETDIDVCIVMELCAGGELFDRIVAKGTYTESEARMTMTQILKGLQYLHDMGIVHRDIKPENLLYSSHEHDAVIKIGDFGLAKEIEEGLSGRSLLKASLSGTPAYCAPERLNMAAESKAVDMWSVGCILYFLLYGVPPFYSQKEDEDENEDEIMDRVLEGVVHFPESKGVSTTAKDLILRLLEKEPMERYTAEQALNHPWMLDKFPSETERESKSSTTTESERIASKCSINRVIDVHNAETSEEHVVDEGSAMDDQD
eukprot:TRINITY_DN1542_c0_g2_i1.p1 TRINITY_DN1542_c0_g2~~TRINITY_DN1542_c0_g2_i1.p1  ORF type:complete len:339 (-),score=95.34 TRINITY_DN1542_c0_g2_i1:96-1112(-)